MLPRFLEFRYRTAVAHILLLRVSLFGAGADRPQYSFGAVLDERTFWDALDRLLAAGLRSQGR